MQKIPKPTEGAYCRIHQPTFPILNRENIQEIIEEGIQRHQVKSKYVYIYQEICLRKCEFKVRKKPIPNALLIS